MDDNLLGSHSMISNENEEQVKRRKFVVGFYVVASTIIGAWWNERHMVKEPSQDLRSAREFYLSRLYYGNDRVCREQLRLSKDAFNNLCKNLSEIGGLHETRRVMIKEAVAMFLYILGHNLKNRVVSFQFMRSGETVSRQFNAVLKSVIKLGKYYLVQSDKESEGFEDEKWDWFEGCLGALDGTYVPITVPIQDQGRYRNRKNFISTNVLGVCSRNLKFTYILPGWEGSAADGRILRDALIRHDPLIVPNDFSPPGSRRNPNPSKLYMQKWKSRQATKASAHKEFYAVFCPKETTSSRKDIFLANTSLPKMVKEVRKETDTRIAPAPGMPL